MADAPQTGGEYNGPDRRTHDLNGNGFPWWVRAITVMGVPSAIAVFLVWMGAKEVPQIKTKVDMTYQAVVNAQAERQADKALQEALLRMLMRVCSNTARNDDERNRCFDK